MEESIISKLRKLKELVDRGEQGEAINAKVLLNNLLKKYNIKYEDVFCVEEVRKNYNFKYSSKEEQKLFFHCVANMFGTKSEIWKTCFKYKNGKMENFLNLTSLEYALFDDFYNFHRNFWKEYIKKQQDLLIKAYINGQNLWDISPKEENEKSKAKKYDIKELMAIMALADKMKGEIPQYRKSLNN